MTVVRVSVDEENRQLGATSILYLTAPATPAHENAKSSGFAVAPSDGEISVVAFGPNRNVRAADHGPARLSASFRRTRQAYRPAGSGSVGDQAANLVTCVMTLFADEKPVSPFL